MNKKIPNNKFQKMTFGIWCLEFDLTWNLSIAIYERSASRR